MAGLLDGKQIKDRTITPDKLSEQYVKINDLEEYKSGVYTKEEIDEIVNKLGPDNLCVVSKEDIDILYTGTPNEELINKISEAIRSHKLILINILDEAYAVCTKQALFNDAILLKYEDLRDENIAYRILINTTASISIIETITYADKEDIPTDYVNLFGKQTITGEKTFGKLNVTDLIDTELITSKEGFRIILPDNLELNWARGISVRSIVDTGKQITSTITFGTPDELREGTFTYMHIGPGQYNSGKGLYIFPDGTVAINSINKPESTLYVNGAAYINGAINSTSGIGADGMIYAGGKHAYNDGIPGVVLGGNDGYVAICNTADGTYFSNPRLAFYRGDATDSTARIVNTGNNYLQVDSFLGVNGSNPDYHLYVNGSQYNTGNLNAGFIYGTGGIYSGRKTNLMDGASGCALGMQGTVYMFGSDINNPNLSFHYNSVNKSTSKIEEILPGNLKLTGNLEITGNLNVNGNNNSGNGLKVVDLTDFFTTIQSIAVADITTYDVPTEFNDLIKSIFFDDVDLIIGTRTTLSGMVHRHVFNSYKNFSGTTISLSTQIRTSTANLVDAYLLLDMGSNNRYNYKGGKFFSY